MRNVAVTSGILAAAVVGGGTFASAGTVAAGSGHVDTKYTTVSLVQSSGASDISSKISQGMHQLFTQIITKGSDGVWSVNQANYKTHAGQLPSLNNLDRLAAFLNAGHASASIANGSGPSVGVNVGSGNPSPVTVNYATCVIKGVIPLSGLVSVDWSAVGKMVNKGMWQQLGVYIAKHEAKSGLKDALKFTPLGLAGSLAASAVECGFWDVF